MQNFNIDQLIWEEILDIKNIKIHFKVFKDNENILSCFSQNINEKNVRKWETYDLDVLFGFLCSIEKFESIKTLSTSIINNIKK